MDYFSLLKMSDLKLKNVNMHKTLLFFLLLLSVLCHRLHVLWCRHMHTSEHNEKNGGVWQQQHITNTQHLEFNRYDIS